MESPTYFLVLRILADLGMTTDRIVPVPVDSDGMDVDHLERLLLERQLLKDDFFFPEEMDPEKYSAFVYSIPTFHNPTGACLSPQKAARLIDLSRRFNLLIVCDDVYNLLYYGDVILDRDGILKNLFLPGSIYRDSLLEKCL